MCLYGSQLAHTQVFTRTLHVGMEKKLRIQFEPLHAAMEMFTDIGWKCALKVSYLCTTGLQNAKQQNNKMLCFSMTTRLAGACGRRVRVCTCTSGVALFLSDCMRTFIRGQTSQGKTGKAAETKQSCNCTSYGL